MVASWDRLTHCARSRCAAVIAKLSPRQSALASTSTLLDENKNHRGASSANHRQHLWDWNDRLSTRCMRSARVWHSSCGFLPAARPSVDHTWIFLVLEKAELPALIRHVLCIKPAGIFLELEGVLTRLPSKWFPVYSGVWLIFWWLQDAFLPNNPAGPPNFSSILRVHMLMTLQWRLRLSDQ